MRVLRGWQEKTWSNAPCSVSPNAHPSPFLCGVSELLWLYLKACHAQHILAWARPSISKKVWRDELLTFTRQKKFNFRTATAQPSEPLARKRRDPQWNLSKYTDSADTSITITELDQSFPMDQVATELHSDICKWFAGIERQIITWGTTLANVPNWNDQCTESFSIFVPKNLVWNAEQLTRDSIANSSHEVFNRFHVPWIQKTLEVPVNCSWIYWTLLYHGFPQKSQKSQKLGYIGYNYITLTNHLKPLLWWFFSVPWSPILGILGILGFQPGLGAMINRSLPAPPSGTGTTAIGSCGCSPPRGS